MSDRQLAAIAVCGDGAGGALLTVTLVSGPPNEPELADAVEHKLEALTPEAVASAVSRIAADTGASTTSVFLLLPLALTWHHKDRYKDAIRKLPGVHLWRIASLPNPTLIRFAGDFPPDEEVKVLFLDLTPGHAAASLRTVEGYDSEQAFYADVMQDPTFLDTTEELSPQDTIDKLIAPALNSSASDLHAIHVFRPRGPCSALESALESKFHPSTPTRWASLSEIGRTAAAMLHQSIDAPKDIMCAQLTGVPLRIALADGRLVPVVPRSWFLPLTRTVVVTTAEDGQSSGTVRFVNGDRAFGTVVVDGLGERPRIEVTVAIGPDGAASVSVAEVGSGARVAAALGNVLDGLTKEDMDAYVDAHPDEDSRSFDVGEVIGALPA